MYARFSLALGVLLLFAFLSAEVSELILIPRWVLINPYSPRQQPGEGAVQTVFCSDLNPPLPNSEVANVSFHKNHVAAFCDSKTLFNNSEVEKVGYKHGNGTPKLPDIYIFVIESLTMKGFNKEMPLTRISLEALGVIWFTHMHHRVGGTRENEGTLLFGKPTSYTLKWEEHTPTAVFNLSEKKLNDEALWKLAERNGYHTMYGATGCNYLLGLTKASTIDGFVFHDVIKSNNTHSSFVHSFPRGSFTEPGNTNYCSPPKFREAKTAKEILQCHSQGPYHHKFLNYYKKFRTLNTEPPIFTLSHLLETHGNLINWALDFHVSQFFEWFADRKEAIIIFMGDHGDRTGTPLGLVLPCQMSDAKAVLHSASQNMVLQEDLYHFLKELMETNSIMSASETFAHSIETNRCADYPRRKADIQEKKNIAFCHSGNVQPPPIFQESYIHSAVSFIKERSADVCANYTLERYKNITTSKTDNHIEILLHFTNKAVFEARITSADDFIISQITRYSGQSECTPDGFHPEFCVCDNEQFDFDNKHRKEV